MLLKDAIIIREGIPKQISTEILPLNTHLLGSDVCQKTHLMTIKLKNKV